MQCRPSAQRTSISADIDSDLAILLSKVCPIAHQSADIGQNAIEIDRRQAVMCRQDHELRTAHGEQWIGTDQESVGPSCMVVPAAPHAMSSLVMHLPSAVVAERRAA